MYWTGESRFYAGVVRAVRRDVNGSVVHHIYYPEDGQTLWHDLQETASVAVHRGWFRGVMNGMYSVW